MKYTLPFLVIILTSNFLIAQSDSDIETSLTTHFEKYRPELYRYSGLTFYGETIPSFQKEQVDQELLLFENVKSSTLILKPTKDVFALCHNLIIHSPDSGKAFLKLLNKETQDKTVINNLFIEFLLSGEFGENLAIENLKSVSKQWRHVWAGYLGKSAIYDSSIDDIKILISNSNDSKFSGHLLDALMHISDPNSAKFIKSIIEVTKDDTLLERSIYALTEIQGTDAISYIENIKTVGSKSEKEKRSSLEWLNECQSNKNKFGTEVESDSDFIERFGDIKSPAILWLYKEGLLEETIKGKNSTLPRNKKEYLFDLLIESKGFGLEAVKGQLFKSIEYTDIDRLLHLRQLSFYSPNDLTAGRIKTIGIFIRYLRKTQVK